MARLLAVFRGSCLFQSTQRLPSIEKNVQQLLRFKTTSNETVSPHGYFIFRPFAWYNERLTKRPLLTKAFTAGDKSKDIERKFDKKSESFLELIQDPVGLTFSFSQFLTTWSFYLSVLYSVGDVIAQRVSLRDAPLDRPRMLRAAIYGTFIVAPLAHLHFNFLNWLVVEKLAVRTLLVPFVKVYFDQFVYWAPSIVAIYHLSWIFLHMMNEDADFPCFSREERENVVPMAMFLESESRRFANLSEKELESILSEKQKRQKRQQTGVSPRLKMKRNGLENTKHKPAIEDEDLKKLKTFSGYPIQSPKKCVVPRGPALL
ncbi:predicted protein [Nematostella vectensis]|uniref:Mpv17-like protein n=1 Tax=Nematostella vectensis TaxID=45351 RepID=A7SWM4_NEMVE|nr:predicted protein [Nematostella vectensis]|eukprot:XP_001623989.1 predicted protein [Nematostella vectensis]